MSLENSKKNFFFSLLPPIRIHTWGGYGSQLYALYLSIILQSKLPGRKILFVAHTSGVTKRSFEIGEDFNLEFIEVDDFSNKASGTLNFNLTVKNRLRNLVGEVLVFFGLVNRCNNDFEIEKIKPWILIARGHYTQFTFDAQVLKKIFDNLSRKMKYKVNSKPTLCIQYRLGDLLFIPNKVFTPPFAILEIISKFHLLDENPIISILSDSPKNAEDLLVAAGLDKKNTHYLELNPAHTIIQAVNSTYFVGTTSKLSLWIAVMRSEVFKMSNTFLPLGFEIEIISHKLNIPPTLY